VKIPQERIRVAMRALNPELSTWRLGNRMERRIYTSRGSNDCWHFDGYDKLVQYGFGIHGCVDGMSRKYIWLHVAASNRFAAKVAGYYVLACEEAQVRPNTTRTDYGSENVIVATVQNYYSVAMQLGHEGHIFGTSKRNTRVEGGWRHARNNFAQFWMSYFGVLVKECLYNIDDSFEVKCAHFVFGNLIAKDVEDYRNYWNSHKIRYVRY
jgi:hypothetical protein